MDRRQRIAVGLVISHLLIGIAGYGYAGLGDGSGTTDRRSLSSGTHIATAPIVAVSGDGHGVMGTVRVRIEPGSGRTLLDTSPFIETDAQQSAKLARRIAAAYTNVSLADRDVSYSFNISGDVLGGPSAGAAMTVATIAAITGRQVRSDAAITGTIEPDGTIGQVGGVLSKAYTAGQQGNSVFIVPQGQEQMLYYEEVIQENRVGQLVFQDLTYVPQRVSIDELTQRQFDMRTREAARITEAAQMMLE